jgi:predicted CxxxxCH...CXXCH cytochrome family protein
MLGALLASSPAFVALAATGCNRNLLGDGLPDTLDCSACHGSRQNAAPPRAIDGSVETSHLGVGAHQAHLRDGGISTPVPCAECHEVPADMLDHPNPGGGPAAVVFGPLSTSQAAAPVWNRVTARCENTYCHGATLSGADKRPAPRWTRVDGSQSRCTACHGNPPSGSHPPGDACEACHGAVVGAGQKIVSPARHIDGKLDVITHPAGYADPLVHGMDAKQGRSDCRECHGADLAGKSGVPGCDSCHQAGWRTDCVYCHGGTDNFFGAPPRDLSGRVETTYLGVGSHTEHGSRTTHPAYPCATCHPPVSDVLTPGHMFDATPGQAEVDMSGGISQAGQYSRPACSSVYCHGSGLANGSAASFVPGTPYRCATCHPSTGLSSTHSFHLAYSCDACHATVVSGSITIIDANLHVNGVREVAMAQGTWNSATRTCSQTGGACHAGDIVW